MLDEISQMITNLAREKKCTLLIDSSGPGILGLPFVVTAEPGLDLTDEALAMINRDRPTR